MELQGKIKMISETQTFGSNGFRKRELVVTTEEQYPQHIMVEFVQDKTDLLNNFQVGQPVKISINLRGREWTSPQGEVKYFNTIEAWRIEKQGQSQPMGMPSSGPSPMNMGSDPLPGVGTSTDDDDDLPF